MKCQRCESTRILAVYAKCSDCFSAQIGDNEHQGYVLFDLGVGGGDEVTFDLCLDCGQLQGKFPLQKSGLETTVSVKEVEEFYDNHFSEGQVFFSNWKRAADITAEASEMSHTFGIFIGHILNWNVGKQMPSKIKFINMYLNNNAEIEE